MAAPLQRVALDIIGPLDPSTTRGNHYIMVIVDYCTKWVEVMPMVDQTAQTCAWHFVEDFVCQLGIPEQLHSIQGRQFESALFQEMCRLLRINKTRTTALHPQSDGQTERANRTLLDLLAKLVKENESSWDEQLPYALVAYRSSVHRVTEETPNRLMLGREVGTPLSLLACPAPGIEARVPWVDNLHRRFSETHRLVVGITQASHRADRSHTDRCQKGYIFEVRDQVWLYELKARMGATPKLDADRCSGPWEILKSISKSVYVIRRTAFSKPRVVNVDRLMPYAPRNSDRFPLSDQLEEINGETDNGEQCIAGVSGNEDQHDSPNLDVCSIDKEPVLTSRAPRARHRLLWQAAFDLSNRMVTF